MLRGGRVAGGYGRTYTLLYGQWIYGAPTVDLVMAVTWSGVAWWGQIPTHETGNVPGHLVRESGLPP